MKPLDRTLSGISAILNSILLLLSLTLKIFGVVFCFGLIAWGLGIVSFSAVTEALLLVLKPVEFLGDLIQWLFGVPTK